MKSFVAEVGELCYLINVDSGGASIDGEPVEIELAPSGGQMVRSLIVDGSSHRLVAERGRSGSWLIELDGVRYEVQVHSELRHRLSHLTGGTLRKSDARPVKAPMPGLVVAVEVAVGDTVEPGQEVAIVEAMKMENEIVCESAGVVRAVLVAAGEVVSKGDVLVELEAAQ